MTARTMRKQEGDQQIDNCFDAKLRRLDHWSAGYYIGGG